MFLSILPKVSEDSFHRTPPYILAIDKSRNTGTGKGMRGIQGTRRRLPKIPGNLLEHSRECFHFNILGKVLKNSGECSKKILGNFQGDSGEFYQRIQGMFKMILENVWKDSKGCSKTFRGIFNKISENTFNFKLIKATFYLK